jgi:hypothetical protein
MVQRLEAGSGGDVLDEHCHVFLQSAARGGHGTILPQHFWRKAGGTVWETAIGSVRRFSKPVVDAWCASTPAAPSTGRVIAYRFGGSFAGRRGRARSHDASTGPSTRGSRS